MRSASCWMGAAELERLDVQNLGRCREAGPGDGVGAHDHGVGVERLRNADGSGSRWLKGLRKSQVIERVEAVGAADGQKARRFHAAIQNVGGGFADPVQIWLRRVVLKGQDQ